MPKTTHGLRKRNLKRSKEYIAWGHMIQRCRNKNHPLYKNWGGRGIKVCERWLSFENFFSDMGVSPEGHSLDRINNNGDYEPGNCRWATSRQQQNNRSDNKLITFLGETKTVSEWAEVLGIKKHTLYSRLSKAKSESPASGSTENKDHLLPCPFCGGMPEWVNLAHPSGIPALRCDQCQYSMQQDRRDKTIFFWNRRAASNVMEEELWDEARRMGQRLTTDMSRQSITDLITNFVFELQSRFHITKKL